MTSDVQAAIGALRDATGRLEAAVARYRQQQGLDAFAAPSRLPGWTIGHVVTHLARNADGLRRVLVAARIGQLMTPYDSPQAREQDIERGATRSTDTIAVDLVTADQHLAETIDAFPQTAWAATVDLGRGGPAAAEVVLAHRLAEVEFHHDDLGIDPGLDLLTAPQAAGLLVALQGSYVRTRDVPPLTLAPDDAARIEIGGGGPVIAGPALDLVRWLAGRGQAEVRGDEPLPVLPPW